MRIQKEALAAGVMIVLFFILMLISRNPIDRSVFVGDCKYADIIFLLVTIFVLMALAGIIGLIVHLCVKRKKS